MEKELAAMQQQLTQLNSKLDYLILVLGGSPKSNNQPLGIRQAADYLHISVSHLYNLIYQGKLQPMQRRKRGRILFMITQLEQYLTDNLKQEFL